MKAATIVDGSIQIRHHPDPAPGLGQILVRVRAAGLNGADLVQRAGHYPPPPGVPADIPGMEFAGQVVELESTRRAMEGRRPSHERGRRRRASRTGRGA